MTKQEYENELKELRERLEKLETEKIEEPQSKRWIPKENDGYYAVDCDGEISSAYWECNTCDNWQCLTGNCFKTKEEAEEHKKQIEYTARYKNYIEEHSEPIDWNDGNQPKYYTCFQQSCAHKSEPLNQIKTYTNYWSKDQGAIYASSEKIIWDAIKEIGEDNFKKYVLGVK